MDQKSSYQIIQDIICNKPKHYSKIIKNDQVLKQWVMDNRLITSDNFAEIIHSAVYQVTNQCKHNHIKKFKSMQEGYGFCGPAGICRCANESVSEKVSVSKRNQTVEQKKASTLKRTQTTLARYGVTNNAQIEHAKSKHQEFYKNLPRKEKIISLTPYQRLDNKYRKLFNVCFDTLERDYFGVSNQIYYNFKCLICNNTFNDYIDNGHIPKCKICNPYRPQYTSNQENEIFEYVKTLTDSPVCQSDKTIINPYELDIVVPDLSIAIEYCGLYWHSEANKSDRFYHKKKMQRCNQAGYRLITIFEDEWIHKPQIVKNRLAAIFSNNPKIAARKCKVEVIPAEHAKLFCEKYHLQGHAVNSIAYGCFMAGELVAVMTFGKPRYSKKYQYELIRYCSKHTVVGGAGKLLAAFVKHHDPENIISYCDMRWGTGNLYKTLGFILNDQLTDPSYSYTDFIYRYHRSQFMKKKFIADNGDPNKTEHELAKERKLYRIWDCGQTSWIKKFNKKSPEGLS